MNAPEPKFIYIPADLLARMAPKQAEWCRGTFRHHSSFDDTKAKRDLGFCYTVTFGQGVRKCLDYLSERNLIKNPDRDPFYDRVVAIRRKQTLAAETERRAADAT